MKILISLFVGVLGISPAVAEQTLPLKSVNQANKIIDAALAAHGGAERLSALHSLVQETHYVTHATNQSLRPEPPWDRAEQINFSALDTENGVFVNRVSGDGGGFEFNVGTVISSEEAWQLDYRAGTAAPIAEPDFNAAAGPMIRVTPALLMKQLQARRQYSHWLGVTDYQDRPHDVVTLVMETGPGLSLYFDQQSHMLTRMERVLPPFGQVEYRFEDYVDLDGIPVNRSFHLLLNGEPNLDGTNTETRLNAAVAEYAQRDPTLQQIAAVVPDEFKLQELVEGVFLVGGTAAYGLFVEMPDHLVAIGGTQGAAQRLAEVRKHVPEKPLRYGVLTHHHSDHILAAADYAAEGVTIITFKENEKVVRAAAGDGDVAAQARLEFVNQRMTLGEGGRTVELIDIGPTPHTEHFLLVWLPQEKIIFEADHFPQPATGPIPPGVAGTRALAAAIERLGLEFETIVGAHSPRLGSHADLQAALKASSTANAAGAR